jgi:hypothetical protein
MEIRGAESSSNIEISSKHKEAAALIDVLALSFRESPWWGTSITAAPDVITAFAVPDLNGLSKRLIFSGLAAV